jgi:hypothetical protein
MICGKAQGILIKKARARTPEKVNYYRRMLREHVKGCAFCQKAWKRRMDKIPVRNVILR